MSNTINHPKKQFCSKGHDTFVSGRNSKRTCNQCFIEFHETDRYKIYKYDYMKKYEVDNKEERNLKRLKYYHLNKQKINKQSTKYQVLKKFVDPLFKLKVGLRRRILLAIRNNWKAGSAVRDLGCSIEELKQYLEAKFYAGMTWDNQGSYWELDHIQELHTFDLTDPIQFKQAVHYTNLQPLTIDDHKEKTKKNKRITK